MADSRWVTEFTQHPFRPLWDKLKQQVKTLEVDDKTVATSVSELSRLRRVVAYIDRLLETLDPELVPRTVWSNFHQQVSEAVNQADAYQANRNIAHIAQANEHADNLLSYVRPYMVAPPDALEALHKAVDVIVVELATETEMARSQVAIDLSEMQEDKTGMKKLLDSATGDNERLRQLVVELIDGTQDKPSVQKRVQEFMDEVQQNASEIEDLHTSLVVGDSNGQSTQAAVQAAESEVVASRDKIFQTLGGVEEDVRKLSTFSDRIFGKKDEPTTTGVGGLEAELDSRMAQLKHLESEQLAKYSALISAIEALLPGATSAGLATAYNALKRKFTFSVYVYTGLFYASIVLLVVGALVMAVKSVTLGASPSIQLVDVPEWDVIFRALLYKAPFIAPVVWLALFSTTRRSQYERLQQEYAHKEALASSYESFRRQVSALQVDAAALERELLSKTIDAIAFNASTTLDGKHVEKTPAQQLLDKLGLDEVKKLMDMIKSSGK